MANEHLPDRFPLLVVCDAGAAGRDLLVRRDLDLAWALTHDEAHAYLSHMSPGLVIVREAMAAEVLAHARGLAVSPPVMVLLEPDGWANRSAYLDLGAAVLAQSCARDRILEAVAEISGRNFPQHVRVPFASFVEVHTDDGEYLAETVDMSTSGIGLRCSQEVPLGRAVRVHLDTVNPPLDLPAMVIRKEGELIGLRFFDVDSESAVRLEKLVEVQSARFPPPEMPEGLTIDIGGTFTMELLDSATSDLGADITYRDMLRSAVIDHDQSRDGWPRWLVNLERKLTATERARIDTDPLTSHASAAIDLRILLARTRTEDPEHFPPRALAQRVLDFSRLLEDHPRATVPELSDIAILRGQLLRAVYGDLSKHGPHGEGSGARAA